MIVHVEWDTRYLYAQPVRQLRSQVCLLPTTRPGGQRLLNGSLQAWPATAPRAEQDVFGNTIHHLEFIEPVGELRVHAEADVETGGMAEPAAPLSPQLEHLYLQPTPRTPHFDPLLDHFAAQFRWTEEHGLVIAHRLTEFLPSRLPFAVGVTHVSATAVDFLRAGAGVCQDYAHLFLAMLRSRGIPARYVSGYLAQADAVTTTEASHAWVQVLLDGRWYGFDPANGTPQDGRYVITAVGRDYDDVPPVRGSYRGRAREQWTTTVRIEVAS